jgi:hypothetical protein
VPEFIDPVFAKTSPTHTKRAFWACFCENWVYYFGPWADYRAAKAGQNLQYWHEEPNEPTKEGPFQLYSKSPHLPQLEQSGGEATPLRSLWLTFRFSRGCVMF